MIGNIKECKSKSFFPAGYELKIGSINQVSGTNTNPYIAITQDIIPLVVSINATNTEPRSTNGSSIAFYCDQIGQIAGASSQKNGDCGFNARCDLTSYASYNFDVLKNYKNFRTSGTYGNWRYTFSVVMWLQKKQ
ncbi:hypothetical protein [Anaerorhabdus sp.]|uniref:hypothetical protein n=1 Tax=Anaerorhabdus sp. TaxID=1872524 RepID=UPI002B21BBA8|nr:hypothetical protein [Anaerorhabdus sp.]MEA4876102.1 hypothetical protein [Anaerorhabdus sp.]